MTYVLMVSDSVLLRFLLEFVTPWVSALQGWQQGCSPATSLYTVPRGQWYEYIHARCISTASAVRAEQFCVASEMTMSRVTVPLSNVLEGERSCACSRAISISNAAAVVDTPKSSG